MQIAIIGAGFTGLTAAYELIKKGHTVTIFEQKPYVGGLAAGFKSDVPDYPDNWDWDLDRFYHHWFTNDYHMLQLLEELGHSDDVITVRPITASWYNGDAYQLDSPISLIKFPHLSLIDKIRTGLTLALFKLTPRGTFYEKWTVDTVLPKLMGRKSYELLWKPLMQGKFDNYYDVINLAWFWARIYKRTPNLAYFKGGFQKVADLLADKVTNNGGIIYLESTITQTKQEISQWHISYTYSGQTQTEAFDKVIVTSPMPVFQKLFPQLPDDYKQKYHSLTGIGAHVLVLVLKETLLPKNIYWLNIHNYEWPFLVAAEHTHFADPEHYGGDTVVYIGDYLPADHELMQLTKEQLIEKFTPYLQQINPRFTQEIIKQSWLWRTPYAQPIVTVNHSQHIPPLDTPLPGIYLANMSQVYPWDRGTNYAVELGQAVAELANK